MQISRNYRIEADIAYMLVVAYEATSYKARTLKLVYLRVGFLHAKIGYKPAVGAVN